MLIPDGLPPHISLQLQRLSWLGWLRTTVSRGGSAERSLQRAVQATKSDEALKLATQAHERLQKLPWPQQPATTALMKNILLFLFRNAVERRDFAGAAGWIAQFETAFPETAEPLGLRWQLLELLSARGDLARYLEQAKLFLSDRLVTIAAFSPAILQVVAQVYERYSPSECEELIAAANAGIRESKPVLAASALCRSPATFADVATANQWEDAAKPDLLEFSRVCQSDASVIGAQAAEWRGHIHTMAKLATAATKLTPSRPAAQYWSLRSRLHFPPHPTEIPQGTAYSTEQWQRLAILTRLHQRPNLAEAAQAVRVLHGEHGALEEVELQLVLQLLRPALTITNKSTLEDTKRVAALCQAVESAVGSLPWAQLTVAIKLLRDRQYVAAIQAFEQPGVKQIAEAAGFILLARLLAKTPLRALGGARVVRDGLAKLDESVPSWRERIVARAHVLAGLQAEGDFEAYESETRRLFRDGLTNRELSVIKQLPAAIEQVAATLYEQRGAKACLDAIALGHADFAHRAGLRPLIALCHAPPEFTNQHDAESWAGKVDSEGLNYSPRVRAEALVIQARAAEWSRDIQRMEQCAQAAVKLAPNELSARYWLARAHLYAPGNAPAASLAGITLPSDTRWNRLKSAIAIYSEPTLEHAQALLAFVGPDGIAKDPHERELLLKLLMPVLSLDWQRTPKELEICAALCQKLQSMTALSAAAQLSLAAADLAVYRDYPAATARLKNLKNSEAQQLVRIAGILAGCKLDPAAINLAAVGRDPLTVLESALLRATANHHSQRFDAIDDGWQGRLNAVQRDIWCQRIPVLRIVARILQDVLKVIVPVDEDSPDVVVLEGTNYDAAPDWARWLALRARRLSGHQRREFVVATAEELAVPGGAWLLESWCATHHSAGVRPPAELSSVSRCLDASEFPTAYETLVTVVRGARQGELSGAVTDLPKLRHQPLWNIGELVDELVHGDLQIELILLRIRRALQGKRLENARKLGKRLQEILEASPPIIRRWWQAAADYWQGVTLAHAGDSAATQALQKCVNGPRDFDARAQLGLLAIQSARLEEADTWLSACESTTPAVAYARGLLHVRRGNLAEARQQLLFLAQQSAWENSPYRLATLRLLAAVAERSGELADAEQMNSDTLSAYPADPVIAARLVRTLLRQIYDSSQPPGEEQATAIELLVDAASQVGDRAGVPWIHHYYLLFNCLSVTTEKLEKWTQAFADFSMTLATHPAWFELCGARMINAGESEAASRVLNCIAVPGKQFALSVPGLILSGWNILRSGWSPNPAPHEREVYPRAVECWQFDCKLPAAQNGHAQNGHSHNGSNLPAVPNDHATLAQLQLLAAQIHAVANGAAAPLPSDWQHVQNSNTLAQLWSTDETTRQAAARGLLAELAAGTFRLPAERSQVLQLICHWVLGNDDAFLTCYSELANELDRQPVAAAALWRRAAAVWLMRQKWNDIVTHIPDSLAELEDPHVRFILGLAYSQAAVSSAAANDLRGALAKVRLARNALEQLLAQ